MQVRFRKLLYGVKSDRETITDGVILTCERDNIDFLPRKGDKISIGPIVNTVDSSMYDISKGAFVEFVEEKFPKSHYEIRLNEHQAYWRVEEKLTDGEFKGSIRKVTVPEYNRGKKTEK